MTVDTFAFTLDLARNAETVARDEDGATFYVDEDTVVRATREEGGFRFRVELYEDGALDAVPYDLVHPADSAHGRCVAALLR